MLQLNSDWTEMERANSKNVDTIAVQEALDMEPKNLVKANLLT